MDIKNVKRDMFLERVKNIMNRQENTFATKMKKIVYGVYRYMIPVTLFLILEGAAWGIYSIPNKIPWYVSIAPAILGAFILLSMRVVWQWEKAVVLRLGKFKKAFGPGVFFMIPVLDKVVDFVDQRIRVTDFTADTTLTKDTVPVYVDAIIFWMVWDPNKAILEVENFYNAVTLSAKTSLRDIIGKHDLAELLSQREKLGHHLQKIIDEKTNPWGITALSIEIKDIIIPEPLEKAMSKEAQAERERRARVLLSTAETEIAEKFAEAAKSYVNNPTALQLRGMNMLYEGLKEKGSMVIVPASALENMNMGALSGMTALAQQNEKKTTRKKVRRKK